MSPFPSGNSGGVKMMKTTFNVVISLLFGFQTLFSQDNFWLNSQKQTEIRRGGNVKLSDKTTDVIPVYFLLGTLSDYLGRFYSVERTKQVDKYYVSEKPMIDFLISYIKTELNIDVDTARGYLEQLKMYSDHLSITLNRFYGENDELVDSMFKTNEQIYSFLTGVYYRYGDQLDSSIYKIQMANAPKHDNCYSFLKLIGCKRIFYKYIPNIPAQTVLYFEPTDELKKYFGWIDHERLLLKASQYDEFKTMFDEQFVKDKLDTMVSKSKEIELKNIRSAFY